MYNIVGMVFPFESCSARKLNLHGKASTVINDFCVNTVYINEEGN